MRRYFVLLLSLLFRNLSQAQSYTIQIPDFRSTFILRYDSGEHISCFYRVSQSQWSTGFRKVFLNETLQPITTVDYAIPGSAKLIATFTNEKYSVFIFSTLYKEIPSFHFLICYRSGKIISRFQKQLSDFNVCFPRRLNDWNDLSFHILPNPNRPDTLLIVPMAYRHYQPMMGKLFACSVRDGSLLWLMEGKPVSRILTDPGGMIALETKYSINQIPSYQLRFYNRSDGKIINSESLYTGDGFRKIDLFFCREERLLISGKQFIKRKQPTIKTDVWDQVTQYHYFISIYDLTGNKIVDVVDSVRTYSFNGNETHYLLRPELTKDQAEDKFITESITTALASEEKLDARQHSALLTMERYLSTYVYGVSNGIILPGSGSYSDAFDGMTMTRSQYGGSVYRTSGGYLNVQYTGGNLLLNWIASDQ